MTEWFVDGPPLLLSLARFEERIGLDLPMADHRSWHVLSGSFLTLLRWSVVSSLFLDFVSPLARRVAPRSV